jgi:F0F1-type ATP synthase membrane subunit b/b'
MVNPILFVSTFLIFLAVLISCVTPKQIEQARRETESAMKAALEAAKKAEDIAAKVEENIKEANRAEVKEVVGMEEVQSNFICFL